MKKYITIQKEKEKTGLSTITNRSLPLSIDLDKRVYQSSPQAFEIDILLLMLDWESVRESTEEEVKQYEIIKKLEQL